MAISRLRPPLPAIALLVLALAGCAGRPPPPPLAPPIAVAPAAPVDEPLAMECAPFARALSGVELYGSAADWWWKADGRYARARQPAAGSVLVFARSARLAHGHVAVVSQVLSEREILVTHANWTRGRLTRDAPVWDVSAGNDWSLVRVWWPPSGQMGAGAYPTEGFILAEAASRTASRQ